MRPAHALDDRPLDRTELESTTRFSPIVDGWIPLGIRDAYVHDNIGGFDCKPIDGRCQPDDDRGDDAVRRRSMHHRDRGRVRELRRRAESPPKFATTFDHRVFPIGVGRSTAAVHAQTTNPDYPCIAAPARSGKEPHVLGDEIHLGTFTEAALR